MLKMFIWHYVIDNAIHAFFDNVSANFVKRKELQVGDIIEVYLEEKTYNASVIQLYGDNPVVMIDNFRCTCEMLIYRGNLIYIILYKISPDGLTHWVTNRFGDSDEYCK